MDWLIWTGATVSLIGVAILIWCVFFAIRARREASDETDLRARLHRAVLVNFGALALSTVGLMMVVVGIFLG